MSLSQNPSNPIILRKMTVPASTNAVITKEAAVTQQGSLAIKVQAFLGQIVAATSTLTLQQTMGKNIWVDTAATDTLATSTDTAITVNVGVSATNVTATSHGLSDGAPIVFNTTGSLPGGLVADTIYFAKVVDANTIQVLVDLGSQPLVLTSNGSNSKVTAVTVVELKLLAEEAASQADMPLGSNVRVLAEMATAETVQVLDVRAVGAY